jgi:clan AA aspartic protease
LDCTNRGEYNLSGENESHEDGAETMTTAEKTEMGRVAAEVELVNHQDTILAGAGALPADKIRRLRIESIVDTGASHLVIPQSVADALGLPVVGKTAVRYADQRRASKKIVGDVEVHVLSRDGVFKAIVEPDRKDVLLGAIVLEDMDLIVDCRTQKLVPRDPKGMLAILE